MKRWLAVIMAVCVGAVVTAQNEEEDDGSYWPDDPSDELYLSIEDQDALFDKAADAIMDAAALTRHQSDAPAEKPYVVRIEIYSRIKDRKITEYISVGDLSLVPGFLSWTHDGRKDNGYAVYMYPVTEDAGKITPPEGVVMLYGKSFHSGEEAAAEIQNRGSGFSRFIRYKPLVERMAARLRNAPYQGGAQ